MECSSRKKYENTITLPTYQGDNSEQHRTLRHLLTLAQGATLLVSAALYRVGAGGGGCDWLCSMFEILGFPMGAVDGKDYLLREQALC